MRKGIGVSCVALGLICLLGALALVMYNRYEAKNGEKSSQMLLQNVQENMQEVKQAEHTQRETEPDEILPESIQETEPLRMPTVRAGYYDSIGILSIPVLELELPVLEDLSYDKLNCAPCQYYGSYYEPDFVIAGHSYPSHFGRLSQLQAGDLMLFTDVTGNVYCYEVVLLETLVATATEEMITSGFDLSLYTCTPGGASRVTVRCRAVDR